MDNFDFFNATTPQGNKGKPFPLFELDENGEIKLDLEANLDDNDVSFDVANFKAVNKGLGFHHKETLKNTVPVKRQTTSFKEATKTPTMIIGKTETRTSTFDPVSLNTAELALLGNTQQTETPKKETQKNSASVIQQSAAWLVDLGCVAFSLAVTLAFFSYATGIKWPVLVRMMPPLELTVYLSGLFVIYYLLYFTVLDLQQTFGKSLLGLRLERTDGKRIKVKQTFTRALVSLLSFGLMGLPLTMDFQGKLSDTKVCSN